MLQMDLSAKQKRDIKEHGFAYLEPFQFQLLYDDIFQSSFYFSFMFFCDNYLWFLMKFIEKRNFVQLRKPNVNKIHSIL